MGNLDVQGEKQLMVNSGIPSVSPNQIKNLLRSYIRSPLMSMLQDILIHRPSYNYVSFHQRDDFPLGNPQGTTLILTHVHATKPTLINRKVGWILDNDSIDNVATKQTKLRNLQSLDIVPFNELCSLFVKDPLLVDKKEYRKDPSEPYLPSLLIDRDKNISVNGNPMVSLEEVNG